MIAPVAVVADLEGWWTRQEQTRLGMSCASLVPRTPLLGEEKKG